MKLLLACWRAAVAVQSPLMAVQLLAGLVDDGFTWANLGQEAASAVLVWGTVSLVWAALVWWWLRRRSRTAGLTFSAAVLDDRQRHLLRPADVSDGWPERMRERLNSAERAFLIAEKGRQEEVRFRWRAGRSASSAHGSLAFDQATGTVLVDLRADEGHLGVAGLRRGTAFVAVCQVAGELGLTGAGG
ncbi:hypothetical protein OG885_29320 [Streptomyces sp. NBC_00028]|uniref:hypothetical protein n=1 Tax=Streptomyces sp. NBC_00028 TaxID=2975624 RepID=UPI00324E2B57